MDFPHGTTLTVRRTIETVSDLGDVTYDTADLPWGPCAVAPRYATETTNPNAAPVVIGKEIYGPAFDLTAADEIIIDGEPWQIDGGSADFTGSGANPFTGWAPGIVVPVKRAFGADQRVKAEPSASSSSSSSSSSS